MLCVDQQRAIKQIRLSVWAVSSWPLSIWSAARPAELVHPRSADGEIMPAAAFAGGRQTANAERLKRVNDKRDSPCLRIVQGLKPLRTSCKCNRAGGQFAGGSLTQMYCRFSRKMIRTFFRYRSRTSGGRGAGLYKKSETSADALRSAVSSVRCS